MATGGRVVHHLARMLPDPKNSVILTGYQAVGTRGRSLLDGAKMLKMFGQEIDVNAQIELVDYFSVHADQDELVSWLESARQRPKVVFAIHGDDDTSETFASLLREKGFNAYAPVLEEVLEL
jgi:metallo-beta-lactamase family protein